MCEFAIVNWESYLKILKKVDEKKIQDKVNFLMEIPLFEGISKIKLLKFQLSMAEKRFIKDQVVINEHDNIKFVYIIKEGDFEMVSNKYASKLE